MRDSLSSIRTFLLPGAKMPERISSGAVGFDLFAYSAQNKETQELDQLPAEIQPGETRLITTGVRMAIPFPYEAQLRPRSGLAIKFSVGIGNAPGTIDSDYRGEIGCVVQNLGQQSFIVEPSMRIAQLIFDKPEIPDLIPVNSIEQLGDTARGSGGFGSTGLYGSGLGTADYINEQRRWDIYFMNIVLQTAAMSNCIRGCPLDENNCPQRNTKGELIGQQRRYGCVIAYGDQVLATGFNCQSPGSELCEKVGCLRDSMDIPSGTQIEMCRAIHAEQKAIAAAANRGINLDHATLYVNAEPCLICARLIAALGSLDAVVVLDGGYGATHGLEIVKEAGIRVRTLPKKYFPKKYFPPKRR